MGQSVHSAWVCSQDDPGALPGSNAAYARICRFRVLAPQAGRLRRRCDEARPRPATRPISRNSPQARERSVPELGCAHGHVRHGWHVWQAALPDYAKARPDPADPRPHPAPAGMALACLARHPAGLYRMATRAGRAAESCGMGRDTPWPAQQAQRGNPPGCAEARIVPAGPPRHPAPSGTAQVCCGRAMPDPAGHRQNPAEPLFPAASWGVRSSPAYASQERLSLFIPHACARPCAIECAFARAPLRPLGPARSCVFTIAPRIRYDEDDG